MSPEDIPYFQALLAQAEQHYARNARWGTCVDCPEENGEVWPERCEHTWRRDHHLELDGIEEIQTKVQSATEAQQ